MSGVVVGAAINQAIVSWNWYDQNQRAIEQIDKIEKRVDQIEGMPPGPPPIAEN